MLRHATLCVSLIAFLACAGPASENAAGSQPAGQPVRLPAARSGALLLAGTALHFIPCGDSGSGMAITDRADGEAAALIKEFASAGGRMTALVRIERDSLREIRYAGPEGPRCGDLPPDGDMEARGQEPFWHLRIAGDSATVRTPEEQSGVTWRGGQWQSQGGTTRRFTATRNNSDTLAVEITATRCADGMSGARYPFRATVTRGGVTNTGCALEGRGYPGVRAAPASR